MAIASEDTNTSDQKTNALPSLEVPEIRDKSYWEKRLEDNWGLKGVGYLGYGERYNRWLYAVRRKILRRQLSDLKINLSNANVLDIGSGTGFWLDQWKTLGAGPLHGTDITYVAVERLKKTFADIHISQLDIGEKLEDPRWKDTFDIVSAFDVLFHITDDGRFRQAIKNISGTLKRGGYFFYSDNFVHGAARRADHQVSRSLYEIERIFKENDLRILRRSPMFVLMNAPIDSSSKWPLFVWRAFLAPIHAWTLLGSIYGAILYPLELGLTRWMRESPTTEIMVCQKN